MERRYVIADVFTDTAFQGNPVAVVIEAEGLNKDEMQRIAVEFGYSETTFVFPPESKSNTARVRIFTPSREIPFAGHPNIGTAFVLAQEALASGQQPPQTLLFEEAAGLVPVRLISENNLIVGAELTAPEGLTLGSEVSPANIAACLSLKSDEVITARHLPRVASVGLPFLFVELRSRDALRRCVPNLQGFQATLPLDGAVSIYAYTRDVAADADDQLEARMFTPRMTEDPATGSAAAALTALLATLAHKETLVLHISQGVDMGRCSRLSTSYDSTSGREVARVGGKAVTVMAGTLNI